MSATTSSASSETVSPQAARRSSGGFTSRRLITFASLVPVVVGSAAIGVAARSPQGYVAPQVRVAGLPMGGLSKAEAEKSLAAHLARYEQTRLTLRFSAETGIKRVWRTTARDLGLMVDSDATLEAARGVPQPGVFQRVAAFVTPAKPQDVPPVVEADNRKLRAVLKQIGVTVNRKPRNARLTLVPGGFNINRDKPGFAIDVDASATSVTAAWQEFLRTAATETPPVETPPPAKDTSTGTDTGTPPAETPAQPPTPQIVEATLTGKVTQAAVTADALKEIDGTIAAFSTYYGGTGLNRGGNIALAAGKINGILLAPGEVFSYNKTVGPRVASLGYRMAPVIVNNRLVPGIGGGICQVSSTLYNAALLADLKIVRRSHHAFPVRYISAGRDATVAYGSIDLQFQNNSDAPVYISSSASKGRIVFRILGKATQGKKVSLITTGGVSRRGGRAATLYRVVRQDGQVVKRERISSDSYNPPPPKEPRKKRVAKRAAKPKTTQKPAASSTMPSTPPANAAPAAPPVHADSP